jgi:hypothetical protein
LKEYTNRLNTTIISGTCNKASFPKELYAECPMEMDDDGDFKDTRGNQDLENDNTDDHSPQPDASKLDMRNIEHHQFY